MEQRNEGITVLFKGGRLASWHRLTPEQRKAYEQEHVDLMLEIARSHRLRRIEGFRLMAPQGAYERFWILDFPDLAGAEAWIAAEMAPPYGRYGYYEYYLARGGLPDYCVGWAQGVSALEPTPGDPHQVPLLDIDRSSVVALLFERGEPGQIAGEKPVNSVYLEAMSTFCRERNLQRLECFKLMAPQAEWHHVWLAEFPSLAAAEEWIQIEKGPAHGSLSERSFALARKWAPEYFASWIPREEA